MANYYGSRKPKVLPTPELIVQDHIAIVEGISGKGAMDNQKLEMRVPLGATPADRHVRAHEMAHAKYSPRTAFAPKGVQARTMQRAEDMRMNFLCRRNGMDEAMDASMFNEAETWNEVEADTLLQQVTLPVMRYGTGDYDLVLNRLEQEAVQTGDPKLTDILPKLRQFVPKLWSRLQGVAAKTGESPTIKTTVDIAKAVTKFMDDPDAAMEEVDNPAWGDGDPMSGDGDGEGDGESVDMGDGEDGDGDGDGQLVPVQGGDPMDKKVDAHLESEYLSQLQQPEDTVESQNEKLRALAPDFHDQNRGFSDTVPIQTPPLTERMPQNRLKGRGAVPTDMGRVPRYMHRYATDKQVFAGRGKRRDNGGVILLDCSGSMSLTDHDVDRLMQAAPAGMIAAYAGCHNTGVLRIIAKQGRRVPTGQPLAPGGGWNIVDYACLLWLSRQKKYGQLYWISDGWVSGYGSAFSKEVLTACADLVDEHQIMRFHNIEKAIEGIRG